jgi:2,3-bisphosphoglycerate-independent phosphoglycerate mutase
VKDHRFVIVFRGEGLDPNIHDTDPQKLGASPLPAQPISPEAQSTADMVNKFISSAQEILAQEQAANMILLRGFSERPNLPSMTDKYKLNPAAIAAYPMYRGLAKILGMEILDAGNGFEQEVAALERHYADHDFFFLHYKGTDAAGEDGDFVRKMDAIQEVDELVERVTALKPDVIIVTGDHSTPALLKSHSWHPVPFLLSSDHCRWDAALQFSETECARGALGRFPATEILPLALANAQKLAKFGA